MIKTNKFGFTLVELLAVIAILAILSGIAIISIGNVINNSTTSSKNSTVTSILKAVSLTVIDENISLPTTFSIYENGIIASDADNSITIPYEKERATGGKIHVDINGKVTAIGLTFDDGYICTMAGGENGCGKMEAKNTIIANSNEYLKDDPNEVGRKLFYGIDPHNRILLKEKTSVDSVLYRIVSIEQDGTIQVIRDSRVTELGGNFGDNYAYDSNSLQGSRINEKNTYCQLYGGGYYGCNAWQAIDGIYRSSASEGTVNSDSEIKQLLNGTFYKTLNDKLKTNIVSKVVNITPLNWNSTVATIYSQQSSFPNYDLQNKIMLLNVRDWYLASSCDNTAQANGSSTCSVDNYLHTSANAYRWWTMQITSGLIYGVYNVESNGSIGYNAASEPGGVKPVFYLSNGIQLSGTGALNDEYQIVKK